MRFKFKTIINIFLSIYKFDLLLISRTNKDYISKSLNLNLLAISKNFQSKGIGKVFILNGGYDKNIKIMAEKKNKAAIIIKLMRVPKIGNSTNPPIKDPMTAPKVLKA